VPDDAPGRRTDPIERLSAVTLHTHDMARASAFYEHIGFRRIYGGPEAAFTSYRTGDGFLNIQLHEGEVIPTGWGRVIFWVDDVDAMYQRVESAGYRPSTEPADAPWGERYFHVLGPDGHELSFARPLER
jgi:catechol 2,3-dioxygenase-like lactoylglutathione lyase family enzyme